MKKQHRFTLFLLLTLLIVPFLAGAQDSSIPQSVLDNFLSQIRALQARVNSLAAVLFSGATTTPEVSTLTPTGLAYSDNAGLSVAIDGDVAIIGAPLHDQPVTNVGAAYIFRYNGADWVQEQKLMASDAAQSDSFGNSVAIDGDVAVVVSPGKYIGGLQTGSTYIFRKNGPTWVEEAKFPVGFGGTPDLVSSAVSISGNTVVVGNSSDRTRGLYSGAVHVFEREGSTWVQKPKIHAADSANVDFFGYSVSVKNDVLAVGSYADDDRGSTSGSVYIFQKIAGVWQQTHKLTAADGAANNQFGYSVALNGDKLAIGANQDSDLGLNFGSAYIFSKQGSNWVQEGEVHGSGPITNGSFGVAVSIEADTLIVGAHKEKSVQSPFWTNGGSAYVFQKEGSNWVEKHRLVDPNAYANNYFGQSVSLSGNNAMVGAPRALGSGTAYVFNLDSAPVATYTVTASTTPGGSVAPTGPLTINAGEGQNFNFFPNTNQGYYLSNVLRNGAPQGPLNPYPLTNVQADTMVTGVFSLYTYTLTPASTINGSIFPNTPTVVNYGGSQTYNFTPATGYGLSHITITTPSGTVNYAAPAGNQFTLSNITQNHTIGATFVRLGGSNTSQPCPSVTPTRSTRSGLVQLSVPLTPCTQ